MSVDLFVRDTRRRGTGTAVMAGALGGFAFFGIAISGSLGDTFDALSDAMPAALAAFVGGDVPGGYVVGELFTLVAPIVLVAYAVMAGSAALAGEERDGTMALLAAQPVSRARVLWAKAGSLALSLVVIGTCFWALMALGGSMFDSDLGAAKMAAGVAHLVFLALAMASIALAVGAATGHPEVAAAAGGVVALTAYLTSTMLPLAGLDRWAELSPWHYALSSDPLRNGLDVAHLGVLAAICVVAMVIAHLLFDRRDLRG